jgi:hypothetical protein
LRRVFIASNYAINMASFMLETNGLTTTILQDFLIKIGSLVGKTIAYRE